MSSRSFTSRSLTVSLAQSIHMVRSTFTSVSKTISDPPILPSPVVRVRSREGRRNRAPPRARYKDGKKVNPAITAAREGAAAART